MPTACFIRKPIQDSLLSDTFATNGTGASLLSVCALEETAVGSIIIDNKSMEGNQ